MCWVIQSSRSSTVLNTSVRCCSRPLLLYRTVQSLCSGICPEKHVQTKSWVSECVPSLKETAVIVWRSCIMVDDLWGSMFWLLVFDCIGLMLLFLSLCVIIARCCHYVVSGLVLFLTQCCVIWCFWCSVCFAVVLMNVFVGEARQTLPQLVGFLNTGLMKGDSSPEHDSTMATALHSAHTLMKSDPDIGKSLLNNKLINSLNSMSLNLWVRTS